MLNYTRILMILQSPFPPDIRVEKEAYSLIKAGYEVHLVCSNIKSQARIDDNLNGIFIHRMKPIGNNTKINKFLQLPFYGNILWHKFLSRKINEIKPVILHVHDLPLAPIVVRLGNKFGIPVLYDRHEDYPEALRLWKKRDILSKTLKHPRLAEHAEQYTLKRANHILVVVDEAKDKLRDTGVPEENITVVSNTVVLNDWQNYKPIDNDVIRIVYVGSISTDRGLDTAIRGMCIIKDRLPGAILTIQGDGPYKNQLIKLTQELGIVDRVSFGDWVPWDEAIKQVKGATVCIVPQPSNSFIDNTIPHKLFEYMLYGKPVVVSDAKPLRRVVDEYQAGKVFTSGCPSSFAEAILECLENANIYGNNGRKAVEEKYNWSIDEKELLRVYNLLLRYKSA